MFKSLLSQQCLVFVVSSTEALLKDPDSENLALRILIVEDDPLIQLGLEQYLEEYTQFQIVGQATNGYKAIDIAQKKAPDLIVMDIGLPKLDGIAAAQKIKSILPEVRIVMLTSHDTETEMMAAFASGADAYCIKGTSLKGLLAAIAAAQEGAIYLDPQIASQAIANFQPQAKSRNNPTEQLSQRELEILELIVDGKSNPLIAQQLYISISTVKTHVRSIMNKLAVNDRVQAAVVALRSGLVD
jgi:two-component system, NarL family, response regulator LiaR